MKFLNILAAILGLTLAFSASAHVSLTQTVPSNEAMLMQSPEQLALIFSADVRLAKVTLSDSNDQPVDFSFKPSAKPSMQFSWPLPNLNEGNYSVNWLVLGGDGHKMSGTFNFMLHSSYPDQKTMPEKSKSHSSHNH